VPNNSVFKIIKSSNPNQKIKRKVGDHPKSPSGNVLNNTQHFSTGIRAPLGVD
jgi:hypothetical protein